MNNMMYPDWQYWFWFRSVFWKRRDFLYRDERTGNEVGQSVIGKFAGLFAAVGLVCGAILGREWLMEELPRRLRVFDLNMLARSGFVMRI